MSNFDMRIPVRELKVLRWQDGRVILELRPAFASVDPIMVEVPEAAMSSFREEMAAFRPAPDDVAPALSPVAFPGRPINDADGEADVDAVRRIALGDSRFAAVEAFVAVAGTSPDDNDLTEEELKWLARSAG